MRTEEPTSLNRKYGHEGPGTSSGKRGLWTLHTTSHFPLLDRLNPPEGHSAESRRATPPPYTPSVCPPRPGVPKSTGARIRATTPRDGNRRPDTQKRVVVGRVRTKRC